MSDNTVTYFKALKARSVAVMGANRKDIFYNDKVTEVSDPDDIYIYRKKIHVIYECDKESNPLKATNIVQGRGGVGVVQRPPPQSRQTYQGFDAAKRRQILAEASMNKQKKDDEQNEKTENEKASIEDELNQKKLLVTLDKRWRLYVVHP